MHCPANCNLPCACAWPSAAPAWPSAARSLHQFVPQISSRACTTSRAAPAAVHMEQCTLARGLWAAAAMCSSAQRVLPICREAVDQSCCKLGVSRCMGQPRSPVVAHKLPSGHHHAAYAANWYAGLVPKFCAGCSLLGALAVQLGLTIISSACFLDSCWYRSLLLSCTATMQH
jgi:hypothetical protein